MKEKTALLAAVFAILATPAGAFEGVWHGQYRCVQGLTGVTLTITRDMAASVWNARFCFCAILENPTLPTGEFELEGPIVPGETSVRLTPRRWISQPEGWLMIPLEISQSADGRSLTAAIGMPGCSTLSAEPIRGALQPRCQCRGIPVS